MAVINPPAYLHNVSTTTGQVDRHAVGAPWATNGAGLTWKDGVRGIGDLLVTALGTPNMTVNVAGGAAEVLGSINAFQGLYEVANDGVLNLAITAANGSLGRNDLIIARIQDSQYSGATNTATIEVVTGTAAASPTDPTLPSNSLLLARVFVGAGVTSIVSGAITDLRKWTAAVGGSIPVSGQTQRDALTKFDGLMVYRLDTHAEETWNAGTSTWMGEVTSGTTGITAATGWSVTSQSWLKKNGVGTVYLTITRTGAGIAAGASGNIGNNQVATLPVGLRPLVTATGSSGAIGRLCGFVCDTAGAVSVVSTVPNVTIATNEVLTVGLTFVL